MAQGVAGVAGWPRRLFQDVMDNCHNRRIGWIVEITVHPFLTLGPAFDNAGA
jgi:hypothetical protein